MTNNEQSYPEFLHDYGALLSHFQKEFEGLKPFQKGRLFARFVQRLIPQTPVGRRFHRPTLRQESNDGGVDLEATAKQGADKLWIQSKYTLKDVDMFDNIFSKFSSFEDRLATRVNKKGQAELDLSPSTSPVVNRYVIVTATHLATTPKKYERSNRPSVSFYRQLVSEDRITIIQGRELVPLLQAAYKRAHHHPTQVSVIFKAPYIRVDDVYIGVVTGELLADLYDNFGDALFLDNIREFISHDSRVNEAIRGTLSNEPEKFLARNNGITFRAGDIEIVDESQLYLSEASIVNGCQTVMSVVDHTNQNCAILAKIVKSKDSWDIAQSANFQNEIAQIDLALARYIRPQAIRSAAARQGIGVRKETAFSILDAIYQNSVAFEEVRSLFLAFFSQSPNNAISAHYTNLRQDVIDEAYKEDPGLEKIFHSLFQIQQFSRKAMEDGRMSLDDASLDDMFQRFWKEEKPHYRAFIAAISACAATDDNIYEKKQLVDYRTLQDFLDRVVGVLESSPENFLKTYKGVFKVQAMDLIGHDDSHDKILQQMYKKMKLVT